MPMTLAEHIEDQLAEIEAELRAGPRLPQPSYRSRPDGLPVDIRDLLAAVEHRRETARIRAEWPARRDALLARRERLTRELERLRRRPS